jgi:molecular chaperone DnaK
MSQIAGIDLGTTFSALSILNEIGKPQIVPNADGDRLTPSALYFDEENADTIRVGTEAINSRQINPDRSVRWIKRHMGDPDYRKNVDGRSWSPVELSGLILRKLKQDAELEYDAIEDVMISVPAHFDEIRRKATMDAGMTAGLNVIGIVNEPVAAALYYATTQEVTGKILVYDLGGGTFDVTIIDVKGHQIDIVCSHGDHALGGIDFDQEILKILEKMYFDEKGCALLACDEDRAKYEDEAEDIKRTLSRRPSVKKILYGTGGSMKVEITRDVFEAAIATLMSRTDILVEVALEEARLKASDINEVLLVGGSTRIPMVRQRLTAMFGFEPTAAVNVDECVAMGAAIYAGLTMIREHPEKVGPGVVSGLKDINLTDVCNHSYGTLCAPIDKVTGKRVIENRIILKKNTPLPCQVSQLFYTLREDQRQIEVVVTQGEDTNPLFVNCIGTQHFELPPDRPAEQPIEVTYSYDLNQRMNCTFEDKQSGRMLEVDFLIDGDESHASNQENQKTQVQKMVQVQ